ncbi:hypothetical protein [Anaeromyxobacter paludicola]|uniref:hypothetical protein n=1 Tax=Anaeromyxobacter paludicola TaxID=2918171 RepID=UPI0020BFF0E0|nr:hypothetical protein [Anaeromyxobacter paludicola]
MYDVDERQELLLDVPMASVPRVGDIVETDSHGERYEVVRVVWIPLGHKAELHVRAGGA